MSFVRYARQLFMASLIVSAATTVRGLVGALDGQSAVLGLWPVLSVSA